MRINENYRAPYEVLGRIMDGVNVIGYVIIDRRTRQCKSIRKDTFDELALNNQIYNCSANIYNGNVNLRGIGIKLKELPSFKTTKERR